MEQSIIAPFSWDEILLHKLHELKGENLKVTDLYAALRNQFVPTAREDFRLPNIDMGEAKRIIDLIHSYGIEIAYPANAACLGSASDVVKNRDNYPKFFYWLEDMGFDSVILAHPYLMSIVKKKTSLKVSASIILRINNIRKIRYFSEIGVDRIILDNSANRNFALLERLREFPGISFGIMTNIGCLVDCPWWESHFALQTHTTTQEDFDYPYLSCRTFILKDFPLQTLRAAFVRPEDIKIYRDYNIKFYKLSGRTLPSDWIYQTVKAYIDERYDGNFYDIIPMVRGTLRKTEGEKELFLDNRLLDGFVKELKVRSPNCQLECGLTCNYCYKWAEKLNNKGIVLPESYEREIARGLLTIRGR